MSFMPVPGCDRDVFDVAVVHGCAYLPDSQAYLPAGHCLSRARSRHMLESEWVSVTHESVPLGLAAYKRADSKVRVVHELLVDRTLAIPDAARVTDALIVALEMVAYDEGVDCLMFMLFSDVVTTHFESHGYNVVVADRCGAWIQKKLDGLTWAHNTSGRPS